MSPSFDCKYLADHRLQLQQCHRGHNDVFTGYYAARLEDCGAETEAVAVFEGLGAAPMLSSTWDALLPFPTGKSELDGDPLQS